MNAVCPSGVKRARDSGMMLRPFSAGNTTFHRKTPQVSSVIDNVVRSSVRRADDVSRGRELIEDVPDEAAIGVELAKHQSRPCGIEEVCVNRSIRTDNGLLVALANVVRISEDRGPVERETSESIIGVKIQPGLRSRCKDDFL